MNCKIVYCHSLEIKLRLHNNINVIKGEYMGRSRIFYLYRGSGNSGMVNNEDDDEDTEDEAM